MGNSTKLNGFERAWRKGEDKERGVSSGREG